MVLGITEISISEDDLIEEVDPENEDVSVEVKKKKMRAKKKMDNKNYKA